MDLMGATHLGSSGVTNRARWSNPASHREKGNEGRRQIPGFGQGVGLMQPAQVVPSGLVWTQPLPLPRCRSPPPPTPEPQALCGPPTCKLAVGGAGPSVTTVKSCPAPQPSGPGCRGTGLPPVHISLDLLLFCTLDAY